MIVMDVNAAAGICRGGDGGFAEALLEEAGKVAAPQLFRVEAAQVAWKYVHAGMLAQDAGKRFMECMLSCVDEFADDGDLLVEAYRESVRLDHSLYDMLYFTLARRADSPLVTCDKRLAALCRENGVECVELVDVT